MALHGFFCSFGEGLIHPVTRSAFLSAEEANALPFELLTDERIEVDAPGDDVSPEDGRRHISDLKLGAEALIDLVRKEGDLAFVVFFEAKEAISDEAFAFHTFDRFDFDHGGLPSRLTVMTEEVVIWRNVDVEDLHEAQ